eukprot:scaffold34170_cov18-Tisochrysis_lutea.AAC.1
MVCAAHTRVCLQRPQPRREPQPPLHHLQLQPSHWATAATTAAPALAAAVGGPAALEWQHQDVRARMPTAPQCHAHAEIRPLPHPILLQHHCCWHLLRPAPAEHPFYACAVQRPEVGP